MDLHHLRTFVAVAAEHNLTRASERLHTSQPAISAHIKSLEAELGLRLFYRTPRGMVLTPAGEILHREALAVLASASHLVSRAKSLQGKVIGNARIGVNTDGDFLRLPQLLKAVTRDHPGLKLQFLQDISGNITEDISEGRLDGGFFFGRVPSPRIETVELARVRFLIAAPAAWAERVIDAPWERIAALPWVFPTPECPYAQIFEQLFTDDDRQPETVAYASSEPALNTLVKAGAGVTVIREDETEPMVARREIVVWNRDSYTLPLHFGFPRSRRDEPMIGAVICAVRSCWFETVVGSDREGPG